MSSDARSCSGCGSTIPNTKIRIRTYDTNAHYVVCSVCDKEISVPPPSPQQLATDSQTNKRLDKLCLKQLVQTINSFNQERCGMMGLYDRQIETENILLMALALPSHAFAHIEQIVIQYDMGRLSEHAKSIALELALVNLHLSIVSILLRAGATPFNIDKCVDILVSKATLEEFRLVHDHFAIDYRRVMSIALSNSRMDIVRLCVVSDRCTMSDFIQMSLQIRPSAIIFLVGLTPIEDLEWDHFAAQLFAHLPASYTNEHVDIIDDVLNIAKKRSDGKPILESLLKIIIKYRNYAMMESNVTRNIFTWTAVLDVVIENNDIDAFKFIHTLNPTDVNWNEAANRSIFPQDIEIANLLASKTGSG